MSKVAVVGCARTASSRLPNKVLFDLGGKPAFVQSIERVTHYLEADHIVVACTRDARDDPIELFAKQYGIDCFRGAQSAQCRLLAVGDKLGLREDDWFVLIQCDGVLTVGEWASWAIGLADEVSCDYIFADVPTGSLLAAFWVAATIMRWGFLRRHWETTTATDELGGASFGLDGFHLGAQRYLIVHFPPEYLMPWPWGPVILDHPVQALVIKEVYRQLYKGQPIDVFDVYKLFQREPRLGQMIPLTLPLANQPVTPGQQQEPALESIRLNAECVELIWEGR